MRVLLTHRPGGAYGYISEGWYNAFRSTGHEVARWDGKAASWRAFKPDLYIGCSGHKQEIPDRYHCKIAIHVNPYGPIQIKGINESKETIDWVLRQRPDVVFGYGHETDWKLWSDWISKHSIQWVPMPTAADATIYYRRERPTKLHDLVYVGGYWPYKGRSLDKYLLPVLQSGKYTYKVYGWGSWPDGLCSGQLPDERMWEVLSSGRVGPCISEPHTHEHGFDLPERIFKVALSGTLVLHDHVPNLDRYLPQAVMAHSPEQFQELCWYYCRTATDEEVSKLVRTQRREVLQQHTYHSRLHRLLVALSYFDAAADMQKYINTLVEEIS